MVFCESFDSIRALPLTGTSYSGQVGSCHLGHKSLYQESQVKSLRSISDRLLLCGKILVPLKKEFFRCDSTVAAEPVVTTRLHCYF